MTLETSHQTEAGCRYPDQRDILLRVVSAMSTDETDVNIIPEFPMIAKTTFPKNLSFDGSNIMMVDLLRGSLVRITKFSKAMILLILYKLAGFC